ncbi:MAG: DUF1992 domain-containing protein [Gammaproteobacteria bacterium]|nr:DUF1992 domain-containing protein [Gammaproteobacteria bacterium]
MLLIDTLAEEQILSAIRRGEFDDLPGEGQPLMLDDDSVIPEELRVAYRLLRNAGCLPPELTLRNEIQQLEGLLDQVELGAEEQSMRRRLCFLNARLALCGHDGNLLLREHDYREKLIGKISRDDSQDTAAAKTGCTTVDSA